MNKKLLKGALLSLASILMAVSCSNNDSTDPIKTEITRDDVNAFIKRIDGKTVGNEGAKLTIVSSDGLNEKNEIYFTVTDSVYIYQAYGVIADTLETPTNNIRGVDRVFHIESTDITSVTSPEILTVKLYPEDSIKYTLSVSEVKIIVTPEKPWKKHTIDGSLLDFHIATAISPLTIGAQTAYVSSDSISFAAGTRGNLSMVIDVSKSITSATSATAGQAALNAKFQQLKEKLESLGIKVNSTSFGSFSTSNLDITTTISVEESPLHELSFGAGDIQGSYSGPLENITISLRAGDKWN